MKTVKTITQYECTYSINQFGNCSFRIAYRRNDERLKHVERVFGSVAECEEYIRSISNSDALIAQIASKEAH